MRTFRNLARNLTAAAALTTLTFAAPFAHADDDDGETESIVYAQRNIVLSTGVLRPEGAFSFMKPGAGADLHIRLDAGADWSPIKNLQVGALAVPLSLSPDVDYGDPRLYARYQVTHGGFQLAPEIGFVFNKANILSIGAPMRIKINPAARIDVSPMFLIDLPGSDDADGTETRFGLSIPLELAISLTRSLYIAVQTGFELADFDADGIIPLGVQVGYSLPSEADTAWIDLFAGFKFNAFIPLAENLDAPYADFWTISVGARFHFTLN